MANYKIGWPKEIGRQIFLAGRCRLCGQRFARGQKVHYIEIEGRTQYIHEECYKKELGQHDTP